MRAKFRALGKGRDAVTAEDLTEVLGNFIPPSYPLEIELQNMAAGPGALAAGVLAGLSHSEPVYRVAWTAQAGQATR